MYVFYTKHTIINKNRHNIMNVFVKPDDQNEIYFSFGMAKKRLMLIEHIR